MIGSVLRTLFASNKIQQYINTKYNKHNMRHIYLIFLFVISFTSCVSEIPGPGEKPEGQIPVTVRIQTSPSTYAMTDEMENHIKEIDILAFQVYGDREIFSYRAKGKDITNKGNSYNEKNFVVDLWSDDQDYRFVIIANARNEVDDLMNKVTKATFKENVLSLLVSEKTDLWSSQNISSFDAIPMWGESPRMNIKEGTTIDDILLLRVLARVDVVVNDNVNNFQLKEVYLYNRYSRGQIVPDKDTWDEDPIVRRIVGPTIPTLTGKILNSNNSYSNTTQSFKARLYTYETDMVEVKKPLDATCLVVGGDYNNEGKTTYYRIDFQGILEDESGGGGGTPPGGGGGGGGPVGGEDYYKPLLRNHLHEIQIRSVSKRGFDSADSAFYYKNANMEVNIERWNQVDIKAAFDGNYFLRVGTSVYNVTNLGISNAKISILTDDPGGWTCSVDSQYNWIKIVSASDKSLVFNVEASSSKREGQILIKAGSVTKTIFIRQNY